MVLFSNARRYDIHKSNHKLQGEYHRTSFDEHEGAHGTRVIGVFIWQFRIALTIYPTTFGNKEYCMAYIARKG
jgi:hypothetical protein